MKAGIAVTFVEEAPVGWSNLYMNKEQDPNKVYYEIETCFPVSKTAVAGGTLFDYGRTIFGSLMIDKLLSEIPISICYGESEAEACDSQMCYYKQENVRKRNKHSQTCFSLSFHS